METGGELEQKDLQRVQRGLHIVIDGHLNPLILLPEWLGKEGLMGPEEVELANGTLSSSPTLVAYQTPEFSLVASPDTFEVFTNNVGAEPLMRDLAMNIFAVLRHTPLSALTISRSVHVDRSRLPHREGAAAVQWGELVRADALADVLPGGDVAELALHVGPEASPEGAAVTVSIQPSTLENAKLYIECRYEFRLNEELDLSSSDALQYTLKGAIDSSRVHSDSVVNNVARRLLPIGPADIRGDSE